MPEGIRFGMARPILYAICLMSCGKLVKCGLLLLALLFRRTLLPVSLFQQLLLSTMTTLMDQDNMALFDLSLTVRLLLMRKLW